MSKTFGFLSRPLTLDRLKYLLFRADLLDLSQDPFIREWSEGVDPITDSRVAALIGNAPAIVQLRETILKAAKSNAAVCIHGESGTGKERVARLLHECSDRPGAFVPINCGAIPEQLLESEFFGYAKGAFTGATQQKDGFCQAAHRGTLFLDEVADLPMSMQVKLLRMLQEKTIRRVGATSEESVDIRIVSASHQNLQACVDDGTFRADLFFRLHVIPLVTPALRDHPEDIPMLASHILKSKLESSQKISVAAIEKLCQYHFPGNIRELENFLERATALAPDKPTLECIDFDLPEAEAMVPGSLDEMILEYEKRLILDALHQFEGDRKAVAEYFRITPRALRYRMERLGM